MTTIYTPKKGLKKEENLKAPPPFGSGQGSKQNITILWSSPTASVCQYKKDQ